MALCLGAVLAYPVPWRRALLGAAGGVALILGLNTLRIGTLGRAAASPALVRRAAPLCLAGGAHAGDRRLRLRVDARSPTAVRARIAVRRASRAGARRRVTLTRRFIVLDAGLPVPLRGRVAALSRERRGARRWPRFVAHAAAAVLAASASPPTPTDNVLWTPRGGFLVTQECISTPLIPVYLAAVCAYSPTWRRLVPACSRPCRSSSRSASCACSSWRCPTRSGSPLFLVHAFYQLLARPR